MCPSLHYYLKRWQLTDPRLLAQTRTSLIYTVTYASERAVLKLINDYGAEERIGAVALRYWDGSGAVRLLRSDEHAHLLEYAAGDDLVSLVQRSADEQATTLIASVLNELHAANSQPLPGELVPLRRWFRSLFQKAEADRRIGVDSVFVRAARLADDLLANPLDERVLHGDIHHENIRLSSRGWLAFDPKGLVGERTFDTANTLVNPVSLPEIVHNEKRLLTNATILADGMGIERQRVLAFLFAYVCLSASWHLEDGHYPDHELRLAALVEPHLY